MDLHQLVLLLGHTIRILVDKRLPIRRRLYRLELFDTLFEVPREDRLRGCALAGLGLRLVHYGL